MGVKLTNVASVEPVVGTQLLAYITREAFILVGWKEGQLKRMVVGLMAERKWHGSAESVDIQPTGFTMVAEAVASAATSVTVEETFWVGWVREEREGVVWIKEVVDCVGHLRAGDVEGVVAGFACVEPSRGFELAPRAWWCGLTLLGGAELQGMLMAKMLDYWVVAQLPHLSLSHLAPLIEGLI